MECPISSPEAMDELARAIARLARRGDLIALSGELGVGKTRFARAFIQARLGTAEDVPSPTFTLAQRYGVGADLIWHFDLYRLSAPSEIMELGIEDAIAEAIVLVEWPDRLERALSADGLDVRIAFADESDARHVTLLGQGRWASLVSGLNRP